MSSSDPALQVAPARPGALRPDVEHSDKIVVAPLLDESALALRKAWGLYLVMALLPPLTMILSIFYLLATPQPWFRPIVSTAGNTAGWVCFVAGMVWIGLSVPVAFLVRGRYWRAYDEGKLVGPGNYIKGNLAVWLPLVIAGIAGFVGFAMTRYVANLLTSVTAFVIFLAMHPSGHVMTRPVGDQDDPGVYEEPG